MKDNSLELIKEQTRFYLSNPDRCAEALLFVRNLEQFAKEVKDKVKERTVEIMDRENKDVFEYSITDESTGEVRIWSIRRDYDKQTKEYNPENVIKALGEEKAMKFLKVSKTSLDTFLKRESGKGSITMKEVELAVSDPTKIGRAHV
jgi:hypothetical protein